MARDLTPLPAWARLSEQPKPSRCPHGCQPPRLFIRHWSEGSRPHLWFCRHCGQDFYRSEVDKE